MPCYEVGEDDDWPIPDWRTATPPVALLSAPREHAAVHRGDPPDSEYGE